MKRLKSLFRRRNTTGAAAQPATAQHEPARPETAQQPLIQSKAVQTPQVNRVAAVTGQTLTIALQNQTSSATVYAYVTGLAIDNGNRTFLLQSDGVTPYYPSSPGAVMQPLGANCAIRLGAPGSTIQARIPHIAGGRIWFSVDKPLTFYLNPNGSGGGAALVEPSVTNQSDPNFTTQWSFAEFTWNRDQLYANISYVDFVSLPVALTLNTQNSGTQHVSGMRPEGLGQVVDGLRQQSARDGQPWNQLVVMRPGTGQVLRVLSPNNGMVMNPNLFAGYYDNYVNQVFNKFSNTRLSIDTQAGPGKVSAQVSAGVMNFNGSVFGRPSTRDIFSCSTGPFATGSNAQTNAIIPRLAAAYNRSTLLVANDFPAPSNLYYKDNVTNHYSRVVHQANLDGKGYAFPYDDVQPSGGADQSGEVHAGDPTLFTVTVGGNNAYR